MTQPNGQAPEAEAPPVRFGPVPTMTLSHDLAGAVLAELWKASPDRFGNLVKAGMKSLWGSNPGGRHSG